MATKAKKPTVTTTAKKTTGRKKTTAKAAPKPVAKAAAKKAGASKAKTSSRAGGANMSATEEILSSLKRDFGKARDALAVEFDKAVEAARKRVPKGSIVDEERLRGVGEDFKERMSTVRERLKDAGKKVSAASERLHVEEKARALADVSLTGLHGLASSLRGLAERLEESLEERRPYFTGEKVDAGRFSCRECSEVIVTAATQILPVCAGCGGKKFRHLG